MKQIVLTNIHKTNEKRFEHENGGYGIGVGIYGRMYGKDNDRRTCCAANGEGNCPEGTCRKECTNACNTNNQKNKTMAYSKKYTNADFYKDGKFQQDVAMEAMKDMFAFYDVPFTELMAKDMWVTTLVWVISRM